MSSKHGAAAPPLRRMDIWDAHRIAEQPFHHTEEKVIAAEVALRMAGYKNLAKRCADCLKIQAQLEAERRAYEAKAKVLYQFRLFD